jgi:hypothetical protein
MIDLFDLKLKKIRTDALHARSTLFNERKEKFV